MRVEELAALVSGARVAAVALATRSGEQAEALERVLESFDRAVEHLGQGPSVTDRIDAHSTT